MANVNISGNQDIFDQVSHLPPEVAAEKVKSIISKRSSAGSTDTGASDATISTLAAASQQNNNVPASPRNAATERMSRNGAEAAGRRRADSVVSTKTSISKHTVESISSQKTFQTGAADSIFRLLPRETRNCLTRMMAIDPKLRCSLSELLRGGDKGQEDTDEIDEWLAGITPCVGFQARRKREADADYHTHTLIQSEESAANTKDKKRHK
jgi:hypothetical protein